MKVKELIELLKERNEESQVGIHEDSVNLGEGFIYFIDPSGYDDDKDIRIKIEDPE